MSARVKNVKKRWGNEPAVTAREMEEQARLREKIARLDKVQTNYNTLFRTTAGKLYNLTDCLLQTEQEHMETLDRIYNNGKGLSGVDREVYMEARRKMLKNILTYKREMSEIESDPNFAAIKGRIKRLQDKIRDGEPAQ